MKDVMKITRTINSFEDYFASPELMEIYRGYENNIAPKKRVAASSDFIAGYVVEVDAASNYGQPFKLFRHYKTSDGVLHLKEECVHSSISNQPLQLVSIAEGTITALDYWFDKNDASRKHLAEHQLTTM